MSFLLFSEVVIIEFIKALSYHLYTAVGKSLKTHLQPLICYLLCHLAHDSEYCMYSMTEVIVAYWHGYRGKNIKVYVCCDLMFPESMNEYYIAY